MSMPHALETLQARVGTEVHVGEWLEVTQARVDAFADATGDHQWIHVDAARAARESPWKTTIAHGYLTLSLYPMLRGLVAADAPFLPGVKNVINYGIDKLRFPTAVRVGSRIRGRCTLVAVEPIAVGSAVSSAGGSAAGALQFVERFTVEIDGESKPACVAEVVMRLYF